MADSNNSLDQHCLAVAMGPALYGPVTNNSYLIVQLRSTVKMGGIDKAPTPTSIPRCMHQWV
jgi:hypothetical protein